MSGSPCPACGGPRSGNAPRDCPRCFTPRPFLARAVAENRPGLIADLKAAVADATGLDPACFEVTDAPTPDRPGTVTATVVLGANACVCVIRGDGPEGCGVCNETGVRRSPFPARNPPKPDCDHCGRRACHTRADSCESAPLGTCRFARMRAD